MISTTVLKGKAIYGDLLLKEGYKRYQIDDLAVSEFMGYEHERVGEASNLYLLAIKKILLYAVPVIASSSATNKRGITLTAQFVTDCIVYNDTKKLHKSTHRVPAEGSEGTQAIFDYYSSMHKKRLTIGDKYTLIGFQFPQDLINNLDIQTFEWKYYYQYPKEFITYGLDISHLEGIDTVKQSPKTHLYLIKSSYYEDVELYNKILHILKLKLNEYTDIWTSVLHQTDATNHIDFEEYKQLQSIKPFNDNAIVSKLNLILEKQIDPTFTISYYETLQATANWLLYNQIYLYGYDSPIVSTYLDKLAYKKSENHKVFLQLAKEAQAQLLQTRAEKITREQYPFYFSTIDRRGIFKRFTRFNINKLSKPHQNEIKILMDKELAYQSALINNKCPHMQIIKKLNSSEAVVYDIVQTYNELIPFIDMDRKTDDDHTYYCKNCKYGLLCEHEVEMYSEIKMIKDDSTPNDSSDILYTVQQIIVNRYKQTQQSIDHSNIFSYCCKYCSKELGKSDDIIQVAQKDYMKNQSMTPIQDNFKTISFLTLSSILSLNIDPIVLGIDRKKVLKLLTPIIRDQLETVSYVFKKLNDEDQIDIHTRLSALILSLCAMISLNINVLKTDKQLLLIEPIKKIKPIQSKKEKDIDSDVPTDESSDDEPMQEQPSLVPNRVPELTVPLTGGSIKTEFAAAFAIIKNSQQYKLIDVSDDKLKSMLLDYYRRIAKDIGDVVDVSTISRTNEERLTNEIIQSPVYAYLEYIVARNDKKVISTHSGTKQPFKKIIGTEITKGITGNVYKNIPADTIKVTNDRSKYIHESFLGIRTFLVDNKYNGTTIEPKVSDFIRKYELSENDRIYNLVKNPRHIIPEKNARETSFSLENLNLLYCANTEVLTKHVWQKQSNSHLICKLCNIDSTKASITHNSTIIKLIDQELTKDAFFELYSNNCPIKDIHIYTNAHVSINSKCTQCGITKKQLLDQDSKYYKQYLSKFNTYRKNQLDTLIESAKTVTNVEPYIPYSSKLFDNVKMSELDATNNQNLLTISKIFDINSDSIASLSTMYLDSYIKLIYERYAYAQNISFDMSKHPDMEFYDFIKTNFFTGSKPIKINMKDLPSYDYQVYDNKLKLYHLISLLLLLTKSDHSQVIELGKYLVKKIISQEARRGDFNFAKLKTIKAIVEEDDEMIPIMEDSEDEEEESMFMAYDIDMEDMEDNIEGDLD